MLPEDNAHRLRFLLIYTSTRIPLVDCNQLQHLCDCGVTFDVLYWLPTRGYDQLKVGFYWLSLMFAYIVLLWFLSCRVRTSWGVRCVQFFYCVAFCSDSMVNFQFQETQTEMFLKQITGASMRGQYFKATNREDLTLALTSLMVNPAFRGKTQC